MTTPQGEQKPAALDQRIRERLDERRIGDASGQLEDHAIRAVLDLYMQADPYSHHPEDIGYCQAMRDVRAAIANALGITQEAKDG